MASLRLAVLSRFATLKTEEFLAELLLRLAVLSRFATLLALSARCPDAAAACGPFSVCYTRLHRLHTPSTAAACGPFSVCYTLPPQPRASSFGCGLRSFLGLLHSEVVPCLLMSRCGLRSFLGLLHSEWYSLSLHRKLRLAVLSRFATLAAGSPLSALMAAACGPFSVCYTRK